MNSFLRYIRSYLHNEPETIRDQNFDLEKINRGGYPSDVVAFAYDYGAVVVATSTARLLFYGYQGASWTLDLNSECDDLAKNLQILRLCFVSPTNLFVLCRGPSIINVKIGDGIITRKQTFMLEKNDDYVWDLIHVPSEQNSFLYCINHNVFRITPTSTKPELLISSESISEWNTNSRPVSCITTLPTESMLLMVLTDKGTSGIYDGSTQLKTVELKTFDDEPIHTLVWRPTEPNLAYGISCSNKFSKWKFDWSANKTLTAEELTIQPFYDFGPYPCNHVKHFSISINKTVGNPDHLIFQGGRSSGKYDDRNLISILHGESYEKLELSSEVIGIACANDFDENSDQHSIALIFTKSEIIGIDLENSAYNVIQSDQFSSINSSNPTAHARVIEIEESSWNRLEMASKLYWANNSVSKKHWPLNFQKDAVLKNSMRLTNRQIYVTGHSNGNVCIWDTSRVGVPLLLVIKTAAEFQSGQLTDIDSETMTIESKKNVIKKIGNYDPFDDDLELQIKRICFDPKSSTLIVSNREGFIFIFDFIENSEDVPPWEPLAAVSQNQKCIERVLKPRTAEMKYINGYQLRRKNGGDNPLVFVTNPLDRISDLVYSHKHNCLAIGGTFGLTCIDVKNGYIVYSTSYSSEPRTDPSLNNDRIKRFSSLKKSLRKTFRRKKNNAMPKVNNDQQEKLTDRHQTDLENYSFIEREIEAKACGNTEKDQVTCLRLMRFPITDAKTVNDVLAVGLKCGLVHFYILTEHDSSIKKTFQIEYATKIALYQKSPVLNVDITNEDGYFLDSTRIVLVTEEEVRVYTCLPLIKRNSYKLTANEGIKIKHSTVSRILKKCSKTSETCVVLFTNDGMLRVHSVSDPSHYKKIKFIEATSVLTMDSVCLARNGEISNLLQSSELEVNCIYSGIK